MAFKTEGFSMINKGLDRDIMVEQCNISPWVF